MARIAVINGHVLGTVDWISDDQREAGLYLKSVSGVQSRCVLVGPEVEKLTTNGKLKTGHCVTGFGELSARKVFFKGDEVAELVCYPLDVIVEPPGYGHSSNHAQALLKGPMMHWCAKMMQAKIFINRDDCADRPSKLTILPQLTNWMRLKDPAAKANLIQVMQAGRQISVAGQAYVHSFPGASGLQLAIKIEASDCRLL